MPRRGRVILPNMPHHIVQRGHNRNAVFVEERDFQYYLDNLIERKENLRIKVDRYCVMTNLGMIMVKMSITITHQQDNWIKAKIEMGHYGNESKVVRELIRERQVREQGATREIEMIRAKLIRAEASGFTAQSPVEILEDIKSGLGRNG